MKTSFPVGLIISPSSNSLREHAFVARKLRDGRCL